MQTPGGHPWQKFDDFKCFTSLGMGPLSPYFDEWVPVHLTELFENFDPDGVRVEGDWPARVTSRRVRSGFGLIRELLIRGTVC